MCNNFIFSLLPFPFFLDTETRRPLDDAKIPTEWKYAV